MDIKQDKWKKVINNKQGFLETSARISRLERKTNTPIRNMLKVTKNFIKKIDEERCRSGDYVKRIWNDRLRKILMNCKQEGRMSQKGVERYFEGRIGKLWPKRGRG